MLLFPLPFDVQITQQLSLNCPLESIRIHALALTDMNESLKVRGFILFCFVLFLLCVCLCRLKQKSQSVDIASQGFSPTLVPASPRNKAAPPVAKATTSLQVQENNTTNSKLRSPRCVELKRGYTIGKGHRRLGWQQIISLYFWKGYIISV